ncbi:FtsX-like permease family protein [uncultured Maribacter sp.]|uniref:ABC transporter permease n=1 Tax=uncultured Maribacter sp. TaxID=431308 RepID=UPI00262BCB19|nr:FtsX-like permease family protein [uncultured Maribacter sp.]
MGFPLYIAKRYLFSKSSQNAVNIINFITFFVIVVGSAALFIVLSGFAGLKEFSLSYTNTIDPDLKALPQTGKFFSITPEQEEQLLKIKGITSYSKEIEEKVYLSHRQKNHIAYIKGVDSNYIKVTGIDSTVQYGDWAINFKQGVTGIGIANLLGLTINQYRNPLVILAPKPGKGNTSQLTLKAKPYNELALIMSGVYVIEENIDKKYVFADLPLVQTLLEKENTQVSGINFKISDAATLNDLKKKIAVVLPAVNIKNRKELNSTLYRMLNTENLATYLIFTLVLIIALFNVVGAIIMMILDKQQNSKTLYNLGTTISELREIYFLQGVLVTSLGGFIGVLLGSLLIGSQLAFGWLKITPTLSYPVQYNFSNVLIVLATIIVLGVLASLVASRRISKKLITA